MCCDDVNPTTCSNGQTLSSGGKIYAHEHVTNAVYGDA